MKYQGQPLLAAPNPDESASDNFHRPTAYDVSAERLAHLEEVFQAHYDACDSPDIFDSERFFYELPFDAQTPGELALVNYELGKRLERIKQEHRPNFLASLPFVVLTR